MIANMYFIAFYALSVIYTINFHTFFLEKLWIHILFIISIIFCSILLLQNLLLFYNNRQIDIEKSVMRNIKKINTIYICVYTVRGLFLLLLIPIQVLLYCEFMNDLFSITIPLYVVATIVLLSITFGIVYLIKKRVFILNLIKELIEISN